MSIQKWVIDPSHSEVSFKVKHLMITTVTGYFRKFNLEVETDSDDFNTAKKSNLRQKLIQSIPMMHNVMRI